MFFVAEARMPVTEKKQLTYILTKAHTNFSLVIFRKFFKKE